jgi:hypothetical protein
MIEIATGGSGGMSFRIALRCTEKARFVFAHNRRNSRPCIALTSPKVTNRATEHNQRTETRPRGQKNDNYSSVTFSAEATRSEKMLDASQATRRRWICLQEAMRALVAYLKSLQGKSVAMVPEPANLWPDTDYAYLASGATRGALARVICVRRLNAPSGWVI